MTTPRGLSFREARSTFFERFEGTSDAMWFPRVVQRVTTDQPSEVYRWLGHFGPMSRTVGGRTAQELAAYSQTIQNVENDLGLEFLRDDVRRDKTGQCRARIGELGEHTAIFPETELVTALEANGTAYDGTAFFADRSSIVTGGRYNNAMTGGVLDVADPDALTSAEAAEVLFAGIARLLSAKNDANQLTNRTAKAFLWLVPLAMMKAAHAAVVAEFTSAGVSNTVQATLRQRGISVEIQVEPTLASGRISYLFRTDAQAPAFVWQEENLGTGPVEFEGIDYDSDHAKLTGKVWFGARRICKAAYGFPERVVRMTVS